MPTGGIDIEEFSVKSTARNSLESETLRVIIAKHVSAAGPGTRESQTRAFLRAASSAVSIITTSVSRGVQRMALKFALALAGAGGPGGLEFTCKWAAR